MKVTLKTEEIEKIINEIAERTGLSIIDTYTTFEITDISVMGKEPEKLFQPKITISLHVPDNFIEVEN
jgi:uncharacterized protein YfbU (UPF0304 family)